MKTVVCFEGQFRSQFARYTQKSVDRVKKAFDKSTEPVEFLYTTWTSSPIRNYVFSEAKNVIYYEEPIVDYSPYKDNPHAVKTPRYQRRVLDTDETRVNRHKHQTKQILMHNYLMRDLEIPSKATVVRMRWDSVIGRNLNLARIAKFSFREQSVVTVANRWVYPDRETYRDIDKISLGGHWNYPFDLQEASNGEWFLAKFPEFWMYDYGLTFHPRRRWDVDYINELHKTKKLLAADYGWYQAFQLETNIPWHHFDGGAALLRTQLSRNIFDE